MPEMQNFNCVSVLVERVVDVKWRVEKPPDLPMFSYGSADVRKNLKHDVLEEVTSKLLCCFPSRSANAFS
jgi:hypothetical protein